MMFTETFAAENADKFHLFMKNYKKHNLYFKKGLADLAIVFLVLVGLLTVAGSLKLYSTGEKQASKPSQSNEFRPAEVCPAGERGHSGFEIR